jgi:hypothetical protein
MQVDYPYIPLVRIEILPTHYGCSVQTGGG